MHVEDGSYGISCTVILLRIPTVEFHTPIYLFSMGDLGVEVKEGPL